jgi:hypothetical protein
MVGFATRKKSKYQKMGGGEGQYISCTCVAFLLMYMQSVSSFIRHPLHASFPSKVASIIQKAKGFQLEEREYFRHPGSFATVDLNSLTDKENPPTSKKITFALLFVSQLIFLRHFRASSPF